MSGHVCMCVCMEKLGSHWMNINEILYFTIFQKSVKEIEV